MNAYRAGMPTLLQCATLDENVALCRELGLSFVELNMEVPIYTPERLPAARLRKIHEDLTFVIETKTVEALRKSCSSV